MKTLSLSELKDALTVLGVSTATRNLKGEARRDELARRLHHAKVATGQVVENGESEAAQGVVARELENLSLSELRSALELRQISTQTPGLKGEARRHALIQRLVNTYKTTGDGDDGGGEAFGSSRAGSSDEEKVDDTKSEASSSVYSTATEFIFYDARSSKRNGETESQQEATALMPTLSLTTLQKKPPSDTTGSGGNSEQLQRQLFELRTKLHTARQSQQQLVEKSLQEAGIATSLKEISNKLQALERERRRLQDNFFGHELVTSSILSSDSNQTPLEFVQEDALLLIEKRQEALKQLAERTKEAMAVAKFHAVEIESGISTSARQEEEALLLQIQQVESSISSVSTPNTTRSSQERWKIGEFSLPVIESLVLERCRSIPHGLHSDIWEQMDIQERRQLQRELRSAASFHIRRGRVSLSVPESALDSSAATRVPTLADKLGMKARFMEKVKRNPDDIIQVYEDVLKLDGGHAENLGSYARFLCTTCGQFDKANEFFQRALKNDPTNAKNLANYANFLLRQRGDCAGSDVYYKRALEIASEDVNVMGGYADLLSAKSRGDRKILQQARQVLKKALSLSPLHIKNMLRLAIILADLNEKKMAKRCFDQLLAAVAKQQDDDESQSSITVHHGILVTIYEKYAGFLHRCGHWERAKQMYDEALALDPDRPSLLRNFSCFLRESKLFLSSRNGLVATTL